MKRLQVYFQGRVQGVGFRYTVQHIARSYKVTGFVRNLHDGRVELVAEGEESELERFLNEICTGYLKEYIYDCNQTWTDAAEAFISFSIKF